MKNLILIFIAMISLNVSAQNTEKKMSTTATKTTKHPYSVKVTGFSDLLKIFNKNDDKLYVVNFWATWCKPCVMELPDFMEVNRIYQNNPHFKMILVSLDLANEAETTVRLFLMKNKIDADVYLLDDNKHMNEWIPAIDKNWSGAIPATLFYRNGKKLDFFESKMQKSMLEQIISKYLK